MVTLVIGLTACSQNEQPSSKTSNQTETVQPVPRLLADWRSFSYNPPKYGIERLLVYSDHNCTIEMPEQRSTRPCQWERMPNDRLRIVFDSVNSAVAARLLPPLSVAGRKKAGTAAYLVVDLKNGQKQLFVLKDSPDNDMVLDTVKGLLLWRRGNHGQAMQLLRTAFNQGSPYARLQLAFIHAASPEFLQPKTAMKLIEPLMKKRDNFEVMNTAATVLAANGRFKEAVATAKAACRVTPESLRPLCQQRLALYEQGKPYRLPKATGAGSTVRAGAKSQ